jgi:tetratricopeptide (TPR) repeat protein
LQAIELANSAEKEFESGNFSDGLKQIALAMNASAGERDRLSKLADDIKLCQRLNEVFQQQAAAQAIRHMGIVVSTREQDAVKRRALEQYGDLLSDMESLRRRFATSPGKSWLAAALGSRAWLTNQFYPDDQAMVENCLEMARELDSNNEINMFLYDSANWNAPATVADKLKSDVNGKASQGALNLATEILIRGNVDPSIIREIVAQRRDNFGVNLRWSSKLAYRDSATGLQFAQVAASLRPDSALARLNLATLLWVNSDIQGALRECKKVLQQNSKDVRAQILLADLLQESDQNELAAATYKRAIELGSDDQDVIPLVKLGNLLGRDDRQSEAAMEKFNQALKIDPNCAFALYHKGQRLDESGKPEEAIALYKQALLLRPSYSFVHNNLGKSLISLYIKKRNTDLSGAIAFRDEAQSHFLAATRIDPENVWAHTNLGNTYNDQGKVKEALACFSSALSLDPKHPGAGFNLANTLLDDGQFAEALEAAKIFIQYYPENANAWFIAGIAESSLQRFGSALKSLKRSIKLADAQGRPAIGQTKMIEELQGMIGLEDKFADSVADAMIESIDPELAAKLLTRKGLTRTSFLTLKKAIESDDKFKTPRISLRAARFGVAAAVAAPSDELAHQYLFEAAELFTQCLTLVENGFEEDFTAEQFLVNVRMTIVDAVQRDALNNYPEQVRTAWLKIHDSLDAMKGD